MSGVEQRLREGLAGAVVDVTPPADPVAWVRSRVARDLRRRVVGALVAAVALAGAVSFVLPSLPGGQDRLTGSLAEQPPAPPATAADDVFALRADPFLSEADLARLTGSSDVRRVGSAPHSLVDCVRPGSEPGVDRRVAAFEEPSTAGQITEFVLRYDDVPAAQAAVDELERQSADCPRQAMQTDRFTEINQSVPTAPLYEPLMDEALSATTEGVTLEVARDANVLVVIEFSGSRDRTGVTMVKALNRAIGNQHGRCDKDEKFKRENFINPDMWESFQVFERGCT